MGLFDFVKSAVGLVPGVGPIASAAIGAISGGDDSKTQATNNEIGKALSGKKLTAQITTAEGKTIKVEGSSESLANIFSALA